MRCLIVVDYQNDFVNGTLGFPKAQLIEDEIITKIQTYRDKGDHVIFTLDTHNDNYLNELEGKVLPIAHCLENTLGHELYGKVKKVISANDKVFMKHTFGSLELGNYLKDQTFDEIELCGLVSHICVISNAIIAKAALPNARIFIDRKATASFDSQAEEHAFAVINNLHMDVI